MKEKVVIIGGGIAGLTAAYTLKKHGVEALILESNDRLGGRIYTKSNRAHLFELGATWVFQDQVLKQLIKELGLELYPQYLQGDALIKYDPTMAIQRSPTDALMNGGFYHKVRGGTGAIIKALSDQLNADRILFNSRVIALAYQNETFTLTLNDGSKIASHSVIITAPPKVVADQIEITPPLNSYHLMHDTHTWMADAAKFTVLLDRDYWRSKKLSGFVYSNYGIIREIQDHSSDDGQTFGLLGFLQPSGELISNLEKRKQAVLRELNELFEIQESHILGYDDFLWSEYFVDAQGKNYNDKLMPHQNNGHSFFQQPHFDGHLFFAGAETSPTNPGYLEGAVSSAYRAVKLLLKLGS